MKVAKLTIGIISIVLFAIISFQSCAVGIGNSLSENGETSGGSGIFVAACMLVAGILGICTREYKSPTSGYIVGIIYILGGYIGITNYGSYSDLLIWSIISFVFAAVFVFGSITKCNAKAQSNESDCDNNKDFEKQENNNQTLYSALDNMTEKELCMIKDYIDFLLKSKKI